VTLCCRGIADPTESFFLFTDGHVQFVSRFCDINQFVALLIRAGAETNVGDDP
jgi:hypothetical protein